MNIKVYSISYFIFTLTLSFYALGVFAIDVEVIANVPGCGDGIIQTVRGEQCEGTNLSGKNCRNLGYDNGTLTCNSACTFNVSGCSYSGTSNSGGGSKKVSFLSDIFGEEGDGILIFSGTAKPNSWVVILNGSTYFHSARTDASGNFRTSVSQAHSGEYRFVFYSISEEQGISSPNYFNINLERENIIEIKNIGIPQDVLIPKDEFTREDIITLPRSSYAQLVPLIEYFYPGRILVKDEETSIFEYIRSQITRYPNKGTEIIDFIKDNNIFENRISPVICFNDPSNKEILSVYSNDYKDLKTRVEYQTMSRWRRFLLNMRNIIT